MWDKRIRLISWNLHGPPFSSARRGERMLAAAAEILRRLPDVILLQEVWFSKDYDRLVQQLGNAYETAEMPKRGLLMREGGLLAFVRRSSEWQLGSSSFKPFVAEAPDWRIWEGDGLGNKGVQRIDLRCAGVPLAVLNTHLQAEYVGSDYTEVRRRQVGELQQVALQVDRKTPVLAAGDLNTLPREALYLDLTHFWLDLTENTRRSCKCGTEVREDGARGKWIDYVLARKEGAWNIEATLVELIRSDRPDHPYSDHQGLDVSIRLSSAHQARALPTSFALRSLHGPSTRREWLLALAYLMMSPRNEGGCGLRGAA